MIDLYQIQKAILEEQLEGWLFYIFSHRDKIADTFLDIPESRTNSRPWIYFIPAAGEAVIIIHAIEADCLDHLPGRKITYIGQENLESEIHNLFNSTPSNKPKIAVQYSEKNPVISFIDHGTAKMLQYTGFILTSSDSLIQRCMGTLTANDIKSHNRAAEILYSIISEAWKIISNSIKTGKAVTEGEVQTFILNRFKSSKLETEHQPIVAAGINSGNPHYDPEGKGNTIKENEVVQLDIWAKEKNGIFADISWIGYTSESADTIPENINKMFESLINVRNKTVEYIRKELSAGIPPKGENVDKFCRKKITAAGYAEYIRHRTGHSIDREVHGYGVNIDSIEFPDVRVLLNGSCFSIEPGLYGKDFGMRTEIDVYIWDNEAVISGPGAQKKLLLIER